MKKRFTIILLTAISFILFSYTTCLAFWRSGDVPCYPGIEYKNLEVKGYYVYGTLINDTDKVVRVVATLFFCDIFDRSYADAFIVTAIQPKGKANFKEYIEGNYRKADDASKVIWSR